MALSLGKNSKSNLDKQIMEQAIDYFVSKRLLTSASQF